MCSIETQCTYVYPIVPSWSNLRKMLDCKPTKAMGQDLTKTDLREISDRLTEYVAGYTAFLSWAKGEVELDCPEEYEDLPWRIVFLLFAGRGRVEVYRRVLEEHRHQVEPYTLQTLRTTDSEVEEWREETYDEVADMLDQAFPYLLQTYRENYGGKGKKQLGWDYDDFLEERDLLEFLLIGLEDHFPTTDLATALFEHDCRVRERIAELGLENYEDQFFPGRISWYPARFWWHHRPEERIPHPDSLEP